MKKYLVLAALCAGAVSVTDGALDACGSKFLVSSRGVRYQRLLASVHPTSILVYWHQDASTPKEDRWSPKVQEALEKVGHRIEVTFDRDGLRRAARKGKFDVVMMRIEQARALKDELASLADTSLLPIAHFPTRREYSAAKKEFGTVLKTPTTMSGLLRAVEKSRDGH